MKHSLCTTISILTGLFFLLFSTGEQALGQSSRTGSLTGADSSPLHVLQLNMPDEVETIRKLLQQGHKQDALRLAEKYITKLENTRSREEKLPRYYAYNALCTVLTSLGRLDEAIERCTEAMGFARKWSAANNRGTAKLLAGRYDEALADYELALSLAPLGHEGIIDTIMHNIFLTQEYTEDGDSR